MTIHRLLLLAGALAIGACGPIPTAFCAAPAQDVVLDTEEQFCSPVIETPVIDVSPLGEDLPDLPAASSHR